MGFDGKTHTLGPLVEYQFSTGRGGPIPFYNLICETFENKIEMHFLMNKKVIKSEKICAKSNVCTLMGFDGKAHTLRPLVEYQFSTGSVVLSNFTI